MAVPSLNLAPEGNLSRYLQEIRKFPMLAPQEEYMLAKRYQESGELQAAHRLISSHLRLVAKIAMGYRGYGLPLGELISEGNVGMIQAVRRFDPERGFRLATYAMWWIKAALHEYVLSSWSLVRMGTLAAHKKLFFNLRRVKSKLQILDSGDLAHDDVARIATELNVPEAEVRLMNRRISGRDSSLNAPIAADMTMERQDLLVDENPDQETAYGDREERSMQNRWLSEGLKVLDQRELDILTERRLTPNPMTLEELGGRYGISRERVRQIEVRAFEKLQKAMRGQVVVAA